MTTLTMTNPAPHGFIHDLDEQEYHTHQGSLSVSGAKVLLKAPALFKWQQDHPVQSDTFDLGTAAHALVLGAGMESIYVTPVDEFRTNAAKAEKAEARRVGLSIITPEQWLQVCDMADALASHRLAMQLLTNGQPEVSAFAIDEDTGVLRRGRFDYLGDRILTDYKTSTSADPDEFGATAARYGYEMQASWYLDLARDLGHPAEAFAFIVQSKEAPYLVSVVELDGVSLERGRARNRRALERYRDCVAADAWPGYLPDDEFATVSVPRWALYEEGLA
jgi:hypothetical protein